MSVENTTALLLGSWEIHKDRRPREGPGKKVKKKSGIRRTNRKGEKVPDDQWAIGDLDYMERLMRRKGIGVFDRLNYREHRTDGSYARGKFDILDRIEAFFKIVGKTYFILYFTGHGAKEDGSWCIPVTMLQKSRAPTLVSTAQESADRSASVAEVVREVDSRGGDSATQQREEQQEEDVDGAGTPPPVAKQSADKLEVRPAAGDTAATDLDSLQASVTSAAMSSYSIVGIPSDQSDHANYQPENTDFLNDFITYEDVIELWDKHSKGKGERFLMMILDCCHSGMWVDKVNGRSIDDYDAEPEDAAAEHHPQNHKRNDVCIQASCRPVEESMVAYNQCSSFFTRGFVKAQERTAFEKAILSLFDHVFVFNAVSFGSSPIIQPFTPISSDYGPFGGIEFFDSFDDMYLQT